MAAGRLLPGALTHQDGQDVADGGFAARGAGQREVRLDLVAAAAAVRSARRPNRRGSRPSPDSRFANAGRPPKLVLAASASEPDMRPAESGNAVGDGLDAGEG